MRTRKSALDRNKKIVIISAVVLVIAVFFAVFFWMWKNHRTEQEKIQKGIAYLESLEKQDIEEISGKIDAVKAERTLELVQTDENAVWAGFDSAVILGDSRAVGFYFHEFLPEERVLAQGGGKITDITEIPEYLERLKVLKPKQIFLCFGLNDIGIGFWPQPSDYTVAYEEQMKILAEELPESTIYINSILPAVGAGLEADEDYPRIGEYNAALKAMAEEKGYHYIDNTQICEEHADLYQSDGLHVERDFYKYWAANMLAGVKEQ